MRDMCSAAMNDDHIGRLSANSRTMPISGTCHAFFAEGQDYGLGDAYVLWTVRKMEIGGAVRFDNDPHIASVAIQWDKP